MPLVEKKLWQDDEVDSALVLTDPLLFALNFWKEELTIPPSRLDLPAGWRGRQVISKEQRELFLAGADYMVLRDEAPAVAARSAQKVGLRTSRKIAKTLSMEAKFIQIPLLETAEGHHEGMIHTPGDRQMAPLQDRYERKLLEVPMFRLLHERFSRTDGIDNWRNGFTWHWRIEGTEARAGYAMIGLRAKYMLGDEADYANEKAYAEREQTALPGCFQVWGGVPRGVRGIFWQEMRNPRSGWTVFRFDMRANPLYHSEQAWAEQIKGDWNSQRVQTQVLGKDGEVAITSFPVIPVESGLPYVTKQFAVADYEAYRDNLDALLALGPLLGTVAAEGWMLYIDYGYAPSPSELGVAYIQKGVWRTLARYEIRQLDPTPTANLLYYLDTRVLPKPATLVIIDAHGQGFGVLSALQGEERFRDYGYGERAVDVGFPTTTKLPGVWAHKKCGSRVRTVGDERMWQCDTCGTIIHDQKDLREATLPTKTYLTDEMKNAFVQGQKHLDEGRYPTGPAIVLGHDEAAIDELSGTTEIVRPSGNVLYVPPEEGVQHITDHLRCLMSGALRYAQMQHTPAAARLDELGWMGGFGEGGGWAAPWG